MLSIDFAIVLIFFLVVFAIGIFERKKVTLDDYWVNSRKTKKLIIVATVASSYLGVGSLISNAGIAYSGGGLATVVLMGSFFIYFLVFSKYFAPKIKAFGDAHNAYTLPDFLEHRYSKRMRIIGLIINMLTYGFWLSLQILGIGIFVASVSPLDANIATIVGGAIVVGYTAIGGLRADIRTDVFQFFVMLVLMLVFLPIIFVKTGGIHTILQLPVSFLSGQEFAPWYVIILGVLFLGASVLVTADLWQRAYAADSITNVKWAFKMASILVFLFLITGTLLGLFGRAIIPDASANTVIPELLRLYVPPLGFGIILAGFFAAIMSSADTVLLIMSMTVVHDLYQKSLNKHLSHEQILRTSRWTTFLLGALAVVLAVTIFNVVHLAIDAVSFLVALLPAVVFGFYGQQTKEPAAFWSAVLGVGAVIIVLPFAPIYAFIPGIIISFLAFFTIQRYLKDVEHH